MPKMEIKQSVLQNSEEKFDDLKLEIGDENCDISYEDFFENYILKNRPCIVRNVAATWECSKKWIKYDNIDYEYFIEQYGSLVAPIADCNDMVPLNEQEKNNMKVKNYIEYLQEPVKEQILYLKDWHLKRLRPEDQFYEVPLIFGSDWINEYAHDHQEDDFKFVYVGPKDSCTFLHVDVFNSYSWSVNVVGQKKWTLFAPGEEAKLKDTQGNLFISFTPEKFPDVKYLEVIQEKGDAFFVPSGWHHQVTNLLDTISVNQNWVNGCNIEFIWSGFLDCLLTVQKEIEHLKDTPEFDFQCQVMMKPLFGMNFSQFISFVCYIGKKRIKQLKELNETAENDPELGFNHIKFDLKKLYNTMNLVQTHYLYTCKLLSPETESDFVDLKHNILELL